MIRHGLAAGLVFLTGAHAHHRIVPRAHAASTMIGDCTLHAYDPRYYQSGPIIEGHGALDCPENYYTLELQVCLQVYNPTNGVWYTKWSTCNVVGSVGDQAAGVDPGFSHWATDAVCGREYRTYDWGYIAGRSGSGQSAWYFYPTVWYDCESRGT